MNRDKRNNNETNNQFYLLFCSAMYKCLYIRLYLAKKVDCKNIFTAL